MNSDRPGASGGGPSERDENYDGAFEALARKLPALTAQVDRDQELVRTKLHRIVDAPEGRRLTLLRNSPPSILAALAFELIRQSFEERFRSSRRSLELATVGLAAAEAAADGDYLSSGSAADLIGEAWLYVGNARRLCGDLRGAEQAFQEADERLTRGTRDRSLRADYFSLVGSLRMVQRRPDDAIDTYDREAKLRRLLRDTTKLGTALVNRGIVAAHAGRLRLALSSIREGVPFVEDQRVSLLALLPLAESLARDGHGQDAWMTICRAETIRVLIGADELKARVDWVQGLACFTLGRLVDANRLISQAESQLLAEDRALSAALASLDRACVLANLGSYQELPSLLSTAQKVFSTENLDTQALAAFMLLHRAAAEGRASAKLTREVANFVIRSRYDRNLRFEYQAP